MNITAYFAAAIAIAFLSLYLKQIRPDYALCVTLAGVLLLLWGIVPKIGYIVTSIRHIASKGSFPAEYIAPILKIIGISYVAQFASDICLDAGEKAVSGHVETLGKVMVTFIALPIITDVFSLIMGLLE